MIDYKKYLTKDFWQKLATDVVLRVQDDAKKGIMQDGQKKLKYKSKEYVEYKSLNMRRKTKKTKSGKTKSAVKLKSQEHYYTRDSEKYKSSGNRLKAYQGRQIVSNQTAYVDMTLTGETFRNYMNGIKVQGDNLGVSLAYASQDADKVIGNQAQGRQIVGLNKENTDYVYEQIEAALMKPIDESWKKDITINIG